MNEKKAGKLILIVKIKTSLTEEQMLKIAHEREPEFAAIPGIIQKYYMKTGLPGEFGGVYVWDSKESLDEYRKSELAATIAKAYKATEPPRIELDAICGTGLETYWIGSVALRSDRSNRALRSKRPAIIRQCSSIAGHSMS